MRALLPPRTGLRHAGTAAAGSGTDFFDISIPSEGFRRSGTVTSGDIVKS